MAGLRPATQKMRIERVTLLIQDPPVKGSGFCQISMVVKGKAYVVFMKEADWDTFAVEQWKGAKPI